MGQLHIHQEPISFHELVGAATAIAVVRPADPPMTFVEASTVASEGPGPPKPAVAYRIAYDRYVIDEWLRAPIGAPDAIEVASPSNEAAARGAFDMARGMWGHVHHIERVFVLEGIPDAWRATPDARRIVFLAPLSGDPASTRFSHVYGGLSLGLAARGDILAAIVPPPTVRPPPPRAALGPRGAAVLVVMLSLIAALLGVFLAGCQCGDPGPEPEPVLPHYARWDALVDAAWRGDHDQAATLAIDLTGGPETDVLEGPTADAVATTSGALGFVGFAEDREELIQAVTVAARGCGQCHAGTVVAHGTRLCDHHDAALCVVDAVVWSDDGPLVVGDDEISATLVRAWSDPVAWEPPRTEVEARAARALLSCGACHDRVLE